MIPMRYEWVEVDPSLGTLEPYFQDESYALEQKCDGVRCLIHYQPPEDAIQFVGAQGGPLKHAASAQHFNRLAAAVRHSLSGCQEIMLDGELLSESGELWVFDLPRLRVEAGASMDESSMFAARRACLENIFNMLPTDYPLRLVRQHREENDKREFTRHAYEVGIEGVMLKHLGKPYEFATRVSHHLKCKFTHTYDVVVLARDTGGKKNASLGLYDGSGKLREIGGMTMIGKPDAQPGDVVEVKCLYATEDYRLYQPRMLRIRSDKRPEDCTMDQLTPVSREVLTR